jgi:alanine racemase
MTTTDADRVRPAGPGPAEAVVDLAAIAANVALCGKRAAGAEVMAVVKARAGGASWLGVAQLSEALALRAGGDHGRLLSWLLVPGDDLESAVAADIDLNASYPGGLTDIAAAAEATGRTARVHLKVDTGLSRGGATAWDELIRHALPLQAAGAIELVGIWTHLAWADDPEHPTTGEQIDRFDAAVASAQRLGARAHVLHVANSAATLTTPRANYDLVRPGLAVYGLNPVPQLPHVGADLRPAMNLNGRVALVKTVPAGAGISYGHQYRSKRASTVALVPLGYADGIPRSASNRGPVQVSGRRHLVAGRVCMDQFVIDLGDRPDLAGIKPGSLVQIFGSGAAGEPTAQDWAEAADTISYEIVTRIGARVPRRYVNEPVAR